MQQIIQAEYQGIIVPFNEQGWFNATTAAAKFGKRPIDWLRLDETKEYIQALISMDSAEVSQDHFVKTRKGGDVATQGTWMHPDLSISFARWLDVRFSIWCDKQIKTILTGSHPHFDWRAARIEASSAYGVMSEVLKESRQDQGKETKFFHYSNEALMLNQILTGVWAALDRNALSRADLRLLCRLEAKNTVLIGRDYPTTYRKAILSRFAAEERAKTSTKLEAK